MKLDWLAEQDYPLRGPVTNFSDYVIIWIKFCARQGLNFLFSLLLRQLIFT